MEATEWIELSTRHQSATWRSPEVTLQRAMTAITTEEREDPWRLSLNINTLPDMMLLQILSFLSPSSLGVAAQVSRRWRNLSEDRHLWRDKIRRELFERQFVNHKLTPILFHFRHPSFIVDDIGEENESTNYSSLSMSSIASVVPSKTPKQVYVKFFFEDSRERNKREVKDRKRVFSLWRSMARQKPKKIVLYGDGLKNPFSSRTLLQFLLGVSTDDLSTEFKVTGMMSDDCRGVVPILDFLLNGRTGILGAWISLQFRGHDFTLVTICETYNQSKTHADGLLVKNRSSPRSTAFTHPSEREDMSHSDSSTSFATVSPDRNSYSSSSLSPKFHELFDDADGFVCVIDAWKIIASAGLSASTNMVACDDDPIDPFQDSRIAAWEEELSLLSKNCHSSKLRMRAAPLLVLPLNTDCPMKHGGAAALHTARGSIFQLAEILSKKNLMAGRPWQVNAVDLSTMDGVSSGFEWILQQRR